jgi:endonuclease G
MPSRAAGPLTVLAAAAALALALVLAIGGVLAKTQKAYRPTPAERDAADAELLPLDDQCAQKEPFASILKKHLPWGLPKPVGQHANEHLLVQPSYVICYDYDLHVPLWVAYELEKKDLTAGPNVTAPRADAFRPDPRLPSGVGVDQDGFRGRAPCASVPCGATGTHWINRGHMAPNADFRYDKHAWLNTYIMSNMCPQCPSMNSGQWSKLEGKVRQWAGKAGHLWVITGAIFDCKGTPVSDDERAFEDEVDGLRDADADALRVGPAGLVAWPTHFYKIIAKGQAKPAAVLAFVIPNHKRLGGSLLSDYLDAHIVDVKTIEKATGYRLFPALSAAEHTALAETWPDRIWPLSAK